MYILELLNLQTNKRFEKSFTSEYFLRRFKNKLKYSKNLKILAEWKVL